MSDPVQIAAARRRQQQCPDVWRDVVEGRIAPDEAAEQDTEAAPETLAASRALFAPVDEQTQLAAIDEIVAAVGPLPSPAVARPEPSRATWRFAAAAGVALAAAVVLVVLMQPPADVETDGANVVAQLGVSFELELSGGVAAVRSAGGTAPAGPFELQPSAPFELTVRPEVTVPSGRAADLVMFAFGEGQSRRLTPQVERARSGTMIIAGRVDAQLGLPPGEWTLVVVVGPKGHLPQEPALVVEQAPVPAHWQILRRTIRIVD